MWKVFGAYFSENCIDSIHVKHKTRWPTFRPIQCTSENAYFSRQPCNSIGSGKSWHTRADTSLCSCAVYLQQHIVAWPGGDLHIVSACRAALVYFTAVSLYKQLTRMLTINPLECKDNCSATSNDMKLVHWPLMGAWAVTFSTVRRGLGELGSFPVYQSQYCYIYNGLLLCGLMCPLKGSRGNSNPNMICCFERGSSIYQSSPMSAIKLRFYHGWW